MLSKQLEEFYESFEIWQKKGSPEMIPVKSQRGPFSNKLSLESNLKLYYLYNPSYSNIYDELDKIIQRGIK